MSFGKLYGNTGNPRSRSLLAIAKATNLDIELVPTEPSEGVSNDYRLLNRLGKIPTFQGADGFVLSETIAIAVFFASQNEKTTLLGKTKQDYASILRWLSYGNSEILPAIANWWRPLAGLGLYNKKINDADIETAKAKLKVLEDHLLINTYLVGERLTLADIITAMSLVRGFEKVLDKAWRKENPSTVRWFQTIVNQPFWKDSTGAVTFIDEAIKYTAPKKEAAPKAAAAAPAPKAAPKPKAAAAAADDDEEEDKPAPKPKHPLEELGKPTFALDDWKRKYKNDETRESALPWFWENVNFDEYSVWQIDYKYNDELTMTFMSSNLITGFFNRLEASRKYLMGCQSVYGKTNESVIRGAFVIRGQDYKPAFEVAPDWESYEFRKLDPKSESDRAAVDDLWAWDKPVTAGGNSYEHADGKIFV